MSVNTAVPMVCYICNGVIDVPGEYWVVPGRGFRHKQCESQNDGRTHYNGCWTEHLDCARARIAELEAENAALRELVWHLRDGLFAICETTEAQYIPNSGQCIPDGAHHFGLMKDFGGKPSDDAWKASDFMRGRAYEAKHVRIAFGDMVADLTPADIAERVKKERAVVDAAHRTLKLGTACSWPDAPIDYHAAYELKDALRALDRESNDLGGRCQAPD